MGWLHIVLTIGAALVDFGVIALLAVNCRNCLVRIIPTSWIDQVISTGVTRRGSAYMHVVTQQTQTGRVMYTHDDDDVDVPPCLTSTDLGSTAELRDVRLSVS